MYKKILFEKKKVVCNSLPTGWLPYCRYQYPGTDGSTRTQVLREWKRFP